MPYKDPEKRKEKGREYSLKHYHKRATANPEKNRERARKWWANNRERHIFNSARRRAKEAGLEFDLEISDILIPENCPILDIQIRKPESCGSPGKGKPHPNSPSLDRIDTSKGYVKGNVWVISWRANKIKADASLEELEKIVAALKAKLS